MIKYIFILLSFLLAGCFKQSSDDLSEQSVDNERALRKQACAQVDFEINVFGQENLRQFFICSNWQNELPEIYTEFLNSVKWKSFFNNLNKFFIKDEQRRTRFSKLTVEMGDENQFASLFQEASLFWDNNLTEDLLTAIDETDESWRLWYLMAIDEDTTKDFAQFSTQWQQLIIPFSSAITEQVKLLSKEEYFAKQRLSTLSSFADFMLTTDAEQTLLLYLRLLRSRSSINQENNLLSLLRKTSEEQKRNVLLYFSKQNPELLSQLQVLRGLMPSFSCPEELDNQFSINGHNIYHLFAGDLLKLDQNDFFARYIDLYYQADFLDQICDLNNLGQEDSKIDFKHTYFAVNDFLQIPFGFNLSKLVMLTAKDLEYERTYIFDYLISKSFKQLNQLLPIMDRDKNNDLIATMIKISDKLSEDQLIFFSKFYEKMLEEDNLKALKVLAKFWQNLSQISQQKLLSIFDNLMVNGQDSELNISFHFDLWREIYIFLSKKNLHDEQEQKQWLEKARSFLRFFNSNPGSGEKLFSANYLPNLLSTFAQGQKLLQLNLFQKLPSQTLPTDYLLLDQSFASISLVDNEIKSCLEVIREREMGLSSYLISSDFCKNLVLDLPFYDFANNVKSFNNLHGIELEKSDVLSAETLIFFRQVLFALGNNFNSLDNSANFLNRLYRLLYSPPSPLYKSLDLINSALGELSEEEFSNLFKGIDDSTKESVQEYLANAANFLNNYNLPLPIAPVPKLQQSCSSYFNPKLGGSACAGEDKLTNLVYTSLKKMTIRRNAPSFLEVILQSFQQGVRLPLSNGIYKASIKDFFTYFYRMSEEGLNFSLPYRLAKHKPQGPTQAPKTKEKYLEAYDVLFRDGNIDKGSYFAFIVNDLASTSSFAKSYDSISSLMSFCLSPLTPGCGGGFFPNLKTRRLGKNAADAFIVAKAISQSPKFIQIFSQYLFNLIKTSSSKKSQISDNSGLVPNLPKDLRNHNYQLLHSLSQFSFFNGAGYLIRKHIVNDEFSFQELLKSNHWPQWNQVLINLHAPSVQQFLENSFSKRPVLVKKTIKQSLIFLQKQQNLEFVSNLIRLLGFAERNRVKFKSSLKFWDFLHTSLNFLNNTNGEIIANFNNILNYVLADPDNSIQEKWLLSHGSLVTPLFDDKNSTALDKFIENPNKYFAILETLLSSIAHNRFSLTELGREIEKLATAEINWDYFLDFFNKPNNLRLLQNLFRIQTEQSWQRFKQALLHPESAEFIDIILSKTAP